MRRFDDVIEVGHLPQPKLIVETPVEQLVARQVAEYQRVWEEWEDDTQYEPVLAHLHVDADNENLIRRRINEAAAATQLATATGADLDIQGWARRVKRKVLVAADPAAIPPVEAVYEKDLDYRRRIQLAPESWSVAGPEGAYVFWSMVAETSADATAVSPEPADALLTIMSFDLANRGQADAAALDFVNVAVDQDKVVPFTDRVTIRSVEAVPFDFDATIFVKPGADGEVVRAEAAKRAAAYTDYVRYIGRQVEPVGLYGALNVSGVERVDLGELSDGLVIQPHQVAFCEQVSIALQVAHV
ncbi:MAG: baseplate J/gp47 family protein [Pseudomonadota bacterium]